MNLSMACWAKIHFIARIINDLFIYLLIFYSILLNNMVNFKIRKSISLYKGLMDFRIMIYSIKNTFCNILIVLFYFVKVWLFWHRCGDVNAHKAYAA